MEYETCLKGRMNPWKMKHAQPLHRLWNMGGGVHSLTTTPMANHGKADMLTTTPMANHGKIVKRPIIYFY